MKRITIAVFALILGTTLCYAAAGDKPKADEPVGAVVETGGVFVGKITTVVEKSLGGGKTEGSLIMADDSGKTKIIPLDNTVKIIDNTFQALTLNQLKKGQKATVEYTKDKSGAEKAKIIKVEK